MENSFIIENLLQQNESIRLEFKVTLNLDVIAEDITAFINTQGGDLIIGIEDGKRVVGVENAEQQAINIQKHLVEFIKPTAPIAVQVISYDEKDLILISVWEGAKKPYQYKGIFYDRKGVSSRKVKPSNFPLLIAQRKQTDFNWERMPVLGAEFNDLEFFEVQQTMELYNIYKGNNELINPEDFLIRVGLIQNGNISNACMVLFGKNPTRYIPQSRIRITLYPSNKSGNHFIDDRFFEGNIFNNIIDIFSYLDNVYGKSITVDNILRIEMNNYPLLAMREGILNAIVHRDYNAGSGFLQISIYSNRTEISNYGRLPEGISVEDLRIEHKSILRNPDIAQICFIRKYIEMLGSGTLRMMSDCKENNFKPPIWIEEDKFTTVVFPGVTHNREGSYYLVSDTIRDTVDDTVGDTVDDTVKQRIVAIINKLNEKTGMKSKDLAMEFGVSEVTIRRDIQKMNGLVINKGLKSGYEVNESLKIKLDKENRK